MSSHDIRLNRTKKMTRRAQLVGVVLLIGGLLFLFDVLSPLTPTPLAQLTDFAAIITFIVLVRALAGLFKLPEHLLSPILGHSPVVARRSVAAAVCVLRC
jgi:hypothetical protein